MILAMRVMLTLALIGFFATFFVESGWSRRVVTAQVVARDAHSDTGWRLVGAPVEMVDPPADAYVTHGALGIPPQLDQEKIGSALPYGPVRLTIQAARIGTFVAAALMALGLVALSRLRVITEEDLK